MSVKPWALLLVLCVTGCSSSGSSLQQCRDSCGSQCSVPADDFNRCYDRCDTVDDAVKTRFSACVSARVRAGCEISAVEDGCYRDFRSNAGATDAAVDVTSPPPPPPDAAADVPVVISFCDRICTRVVGVCTGEGAPTLAACIATCTATNAGTQSNLTCADSASTCEAIEACTATVACACNTGAGCQAGCSCDPDCTVANPCASRSSCATCTPTGGCGWCEGTSVCAPGSSAGPSSGSCADWSWQSSECGGGGGGTDNGARGAACSCSPEAGAEAGTYKVCSGTSDGCMGFGGTGQLRCLARNSDGVGRCEYMCTMADEGMRGTCPANQLCREDVRSIAGYWYRCL